MQGFILQFEEKSKSLTDLEMLMVGSGEVGFGGVLYGGVRYGIPLTRKGVDKVWKK